MFVQTARIAIMDQVALAIQQAVHRIREVAAHLIHPQPNWDSTQFRQSPPCELTIP